MSDSDPLVYALDLFKADWEGTICPHCGAEKWKNSPFCRHCSIRLQRKNMFGGMKKWVQHSLKACFRFFGDDPLAVYSFAHWYDRCRDYLDSHLRGAAQRVDRQRGRLAQFVEESTGLV